MFKRKEQPKAEEMPKQEVQNLSIGTKEQPKAETLAEHIIATTEVQFREYIVIQLEEILARVKVIENEATKP